MICRSENRNLTGDRFLSEQHQSNDPQEDQILIGTCPLSGLVEVKVRKLFASLLELYYLCSAKVIQV
jgi:hypothetical protein